MTPAHTKYAPHYLKSTTATKAQQRTRKRHGESPLKRVAQLQEAEMAECTFVPKINPLPNMYHTARRPYDEDSDEEGAAVAEEEMRSRRREYTSM